MRHEVYKGVDRANAAFEGAKVLWQPGLRRSHSRIVAAMELYQVAARHGGPEHQVFLAQLLLNDSLPSIYDFRAAYEWMLAAAKGGSSVAQFWIARELATGENVERSPRKAAFWYKKAARALPEAQYNLGLMYFEGDGVRQDSAKARKLIVACAKRGEILGAMLLADAYQTEELGFRQDQSKARFWRKKVGDILAKGSRSRNIGKKS